MGKKSGKKNNSRLSSSSSVGWGTQGTLANGESLLAVDPARIRFQHSKIRPFFSGCGRRVTDTLDEIRNGTIMPSDLPPIQVLLAPTHHTSVSFTEKTVKGKKNPNFDDCPWYISLNNRRLWVFKRCREEGLLEAYDNKIWVRVRQPKSQQERDRYTLDNCVLEAKILVEKASTSNLGVEGGMSTQHGSTRRHCSEKDVDNADEDMTRSLSLAAHSDETTIPQLHLLPSGRSSDVSESGSDYVHPHSEKYT